MFWLLACHHAGSGKVNLDTPKLEEYAGVEDSLLMYTPLGEPEGATKMLRISATEWEFRDGDFWRNAPEGEHFDWGLEGGLTVGGVVLLPEDLTVGGTAEDATITESGSWEGWYGTFPETLTVNIASGAWTGTAVFARNIGMIRYSRGGDWEMVYYEKGLSDSAPLDSGDSGG